MTDSPAAEWVSFSNAGEAPLSVWLEPWVDEFALRPRSAITLYATMPEGRTPESPDIDCTEGLLTVYCPASSMIRVEIDGVAQESCSATVAAPDLGVLSTRSFVDMVFGAFPETRPGGKPHPVVKQQRWFARWLDRWLQRPK